jgi:hypothetical protein
MRSVRRAAAPRSSPMRPPSSKGCRAHARVAAEPSSTVSVTYSDRAMTRLRQLERRLTDPRARPCREAADRSAGSISKRRQGIASGVCGQPPEAI